MLVLSRRPNESIRIGSNIQVKLLQVRGNQVTLGIAAPAEVAVDREEVYLRDLNRLKADSDLYFRQLQMVGTAEPTAVQLKQKIDDLLKLLADAAGTRIPNSMEYSFIQEQVVPRREAASRLVRELERANESALTKSEEEFAGTRRAAARGLVAIRLPRGRRS